MPFTLMLSIALTIAAVIMIAAYWQWEAEQRLTAEQLAARLKTEISTENQANIAHPARKLRRTEEDATYALRMRSNA